MVTWTRNCNLRKKVVPHQLQLLYLTCTHFNYFKPIVCEVHCHHHGVLPVLMFIFLHTAASNTISLQCSKVPLNAWHKSDMTKSQAGVYQGENSFSIPEKQCQTNEQGPFFKDICGTKTGQIVCSKQSCFSGTVSPATLVAWRSQTHIARKARHSQCSSLVKGLATPNYYSGGTELNCWDDK